MAKKSSTKRALSASILSLLLCFAMLVGSTFAWFTDAVTSGMNKIVAGNLDIDLKYCKPSGTTTTEWSPVEGATELFNDVANWEPGAVSVVYLEIKNLGNLALRYQLAIKAADVKTSEDGGKLSDVLKTAVINLGKTMPETLYTRDTAIAAANAKAASLADYKFENSMTEQGATQYLALIVYFPTEVGNTYVKDGVTYTINSKNHPEIDLGISLVATQYPSESDSFGEDYDNLATYPVVVIELPAIRITKPVVVTEENTVQNLTKLEGNTVSAAVPAGTKVEAGTTDMALVVTPQAQTSGDVKAAIDAAVSAAQAANPGSLISAYDVKVTGVAEDNDKPIQVEMSVGKGLSNVKIFHGTTEVEGVVYNAETGMATFTTTTFSPFVAVYDLSVAYVEIDGAKNYFATTAEAVEAAGKVAGGATVNIIGAVDVPVVVPEGASGDIGELVRVIEPKYGYTALDLEGKTVDVDVKVLKHSSYNMTITNGTINGNLTYEDGSNRANYSLENLTVTGDVYLGNRYFSSGSCGIATLVNVTINGTLTVGSTVDPYVNLPYSSWGKGSTVRILSGSYNEIVVDDTYGSELLVKGGTFKQSVAAYLESPAFEIANDDGTYTVDVTPCAKVGDTTYKNMEDAFAAALESGNTVELLEDATMEESVTIVSGKSITLDFAGHKLLAPPPSGNAFFIQGGSLTINDMSADKTGSLNSRGFNGELIKFAAGGGSFTLNGGSLYATASAAIGEYRIAKTDTININIYGGLIDASYQAINCNSCKLNINMTDGKLRSAERDVISVGSDAAALGTVINISGGTLKADYATTRECIFVSSTNNGAPYNTVINISGSAQILGSSATGRSFYLNGGQLNISGGTISGKILTSNSPTIVVTGGTYDVDPADKYNGCGKYIAEGYQAVKNADNTWTVSAN